MSLALAQSSTLIRTPLARHLRALERHESLVWDHIAYCRDKVGPCLVLFCLTPGRISRGYLPLRHCSVISLMTFGLEEHEAIEIQKAVERCDLRADAAVLLADVDFKSGLCSFVEVRV